MGLLKVLIVMVQMVAIVYLAQSQLTVVVVVVVLGQQRVLVLGRDIVEVLVEVKAYKVPMNLQEVLVIRERMEEEVGTAMDVPKVQVEVEETPVLVVQLLQQLVEVEEAVQQIV